MCKTGRYADLKSGCGPGNGGDVAVCRRPEAPDGASVEQRLGRRNNHIGLSPGNPDTVERILMFDVYLTRPIPAWSMPSGNSLRP
jgi:hypothetical protein